jgi:hypothetical protein
MTRPRRRQLELLLIVRRAERVDVVTVSALRPRPVRQGQVPLRTMRPG